MELFLTKIFIKRYGDLPKGYQEKVKRLVESLPIFPTTGKKLSGNLSGHYSLRIGSYRILYMIKNEAIFVETVNHRKEVYKR